MTGSRVTARPLRGPEFGSYRADEVTWLLKDLSAHALEGDLAERERRVQNGTAHYAESLPVEFQPGAEYQQLFHTTLRQTAGRIADAVAVVGELLVAERHPQPVLVSLARAGTPVGILIRRWVEFAHGIALPHYAVSIVRDRGIDANALRYIVGEHDPESVVFVDGWTGKGAIQRELTAALREFEQSGGPRLHDGLAVLADTGYCTGTFGTRDDFLIASACLNSTVSGLVSRTVLNRDYIGPDDFHGAKFYRELAPHDVSGLLLDTITDEFPAVAERLPALMHAIAGTDRTPTWAGWRAVEQIQAQYGLSSINFVKPGVGETTRVLLRRIPWRVLLREADLADHAHIRLLAAERGVPVEVVPDLTYSCVGLIKETG